MSFSLNEVDAMAKKATRGCGYSWGMAEEAGFATRWLSAHCLDGVKALALALEQADGADLEQMKPTGLQDPWQAESGSLCALMAGASIADSPKLWAANGLRLQAVNVPLLVLPFVAQAAQRLGAVVTVHWEGVSAVFENDAVSLKTANSNSLFTPVTEMTVNTGGQIGAPLSNQSRATPRPEDWRFLSGLAARTYAPATEDSRRKGAGAGLADND